MGIFGNLVKLAVDVAVTPLAIAKDVITLGGSITDEEAATPQKLEDIVQDAEDLFDL